MPKVDFYLLEEQTSESVLLFACRLTAKLYSDDKSIYLHTENADQAKELDQMLWRFRAESFIPHEIVEENLSENAKESSLSPVFISCNPNLLQKCEVLVNLASDIPSFYRDFKRIAEIVSSDEAHRHTLRQHYRFYKEHDCILKTHTI